MNWQSPLRLDGEALELHYRHILEELGKKPGMLDDIFKEARQKIRNPSTLRRLIVDLIDAEQWSSMDDDVKGGHLRRSALQSAAESPKGAGQYFNPCERIKVIDDSVQPTPDDTVAIRPAGRADSCWRLMTTSSDIVARREIATPDP